MTRIPRDEDPKEPDLGRLERAKRDTKHEMEKVYDEILGELAEYSSKLSYV